jgi:hypothetical protein
MIIKTQDSDVIMSYSRAFALLSWLFRKTKDQS